MTQDEIAVMDVEMYFVLRGVRPFKRQNDITKHPNYKYLPTSTRKRF